MTIAPHELAPRLAARGLDWIIPDWPAPPHVGALVTTRHGGVSTGPYASQNLGFHVGDDPLAVAWNGAQLGEICGAKPVWLQQVHGTDAVDLATLSGVTPAADAAVSRLPGVAPAILTADCLPVLFTDRAGSVVAAAHAGWRGLCGGVLESAVRAMAVPPADILAWLGPAISAAAFQVGDEVRAAFCAIDRDAAAAFVADELPGKWRADLYALARARLAGCGVHEVYGGGACTFADTERFYSYRRNAVTGRLASLVWRAALS